MRIACISTSTVPSRTANSIQLMKVCQSLIDLGHSVRLWVPAARGPSDWRQIGPHYGVRGGFEIARLPRFPGLRGYDFCLRAVWAGRRWGADLLYVWPYQAAVFGGWSGLPTVLELHDQPTGRMGPALLRAFVRSRGEVRVLYTSRGLRDTVQATLDRKLDAPLAIHAPNGVELERYQDLPQPAQARQELGLPEQFTAGYTGHLYAGRGLELLLELASANPDIGFLWAGGDPPSVEDWRARIGSEGITNVQIMGFVENRRLPLVQAACEVLLMPYERRIAVSSGGDTAATASPMKLFEYLASGRAILSSDLPVIREVLHDQNALLLPPEDPAAWSRALRRLAEEPVQREALAVRAREDAQQYSWTRRAGRALEGFPAANRDRSPGTDSRT